MLTFLSQDVFLISVHEASLVDSSFSVSSAPPSVVCPLKVDSVGLAVHPFRSQEAHAGFGWTGADEGRARRLVC